MCHNKWFYRILGSFLVLLLMLPAFGILRERRNRELIGEMENRTINPKPSAKLFSAKYFKELEAWFGDRLLGRKEFIRTWSMLNGKLFKVLISKEIVQGKEGYLFMPFNLTSEVLDLDKKINTLKQLQENCSKHNARLVFFTAPHGEWVLGELLPDKYKAVNLYTVDDVLAAKLEAIGIKFVSINKDLGQMNLDDRKSMYYQGDYHWNSKGAYFGVKKILKSLNYDDKINAPIVCEKTISKADIYTKKVGWPAIVSEYDKPWNGNFTRDFQQKYTAEGVTKVAEAGKNMGYTHKGEEIYVNSKAKNKVKILALSDSFMGDMKEYLLQDIETLIVVHNSDISRPKKQIDIDYLLNYYKPDVVLYEKMGAFFYGHNYVDVFGNWKEHSINK